MSEAITKECETCGGWLRHYRGCEDRDRPFVHPDTQPDASTGRVPDVEATLRAEVARLTEERKTRDASDAKARHRRLLRGRATQRQRNAARTRHKRLVDSLTAKLADRDAALATARAEVERLTARLDIAIRACNTVTYGDGGITECADVVGEIENSKRLNEMQEGAE